MTGEVVNISDKTIVLNRDGVNEAAITVAEWATELARSGEVVGVAIVVAFADGSSGHRYGGNIKTIGTIGTLTKMATMLSQE